MDSYVFGDGVWAFPAFMRKNHKEVKFFSMKRMVGNRALVFHENALIHFYMTPFYLEWCNYVSKHCKEGNMLHVRVEAQLRCAEELSGLRARAITFDKIHQPWRVFINSLQPETGKPRRFLEQGPALRKLYAVGKALTEDPNFITHVDWRFLEGAGYEDVDEHHNKWRKHRKNEPMLKYLYTDVDQDEFLVPYLRAQGAAITTQLERNSSDFLEGGRYFDPSAETISEMITAPGTSVDIERQFAIRDYVSRTSAPTMSFHSKSAKAAYLANDTHGWYSQHSSPLQDLIIQRVRYNERGCWRQSHRSLERADKMKLEGKAERMQAARKSILREIKTCLALEGKQPFVTVASWDDFTKEQACRKTLVDREIRSQVRLLITLYGKKKKDLMIFKGLDHDGMQTTFRNLVRRIEKGDLGPMKRSTIVERMKTDAHIFRGGTSSATAAALDDEDERWMQKLVDKARGEMQTAATKHKSRSSKTSKRKTSIIGRTVSMKKSIWGGSANEFYYGTVKKKRRIKV